MPFAPNFDPVYRAIGAASRTAGLTPKRADGVFEGKAILQKILAGIEESRVVVADVTGRNANVFYELGIAHVRKDATVLVTQDIQDVPFDLRHLELMEYSAQPQGLRKLKRDLSPILMRLWSNASDESPATDVKILYWSMSPRGPNGAGLIVENIGEQVALDLMGERLTPTGSYDTSESLRSLRSGERTGILDWQPAKRPADAPSAPQSSRYLTRVGWSDPQGRRYVGEWTQTEKR
jgi:hypothetical protein